MHSDLHKVSRFVDISALRVSLGFQGRRRFSGNDFDRRKSDQPYDIHPPSDEFFPLTRARSVPYQLQYTQQPLLPPKPPQYSGNYQQQPTPIAQSTPFHTNPYNDSGFVPSYGSSLPNINISDPKMGNKLSTNAYAGSTYPANFTTNNFGPVENHYELKKQNEDLKEELDFIRTQMANQSSELNYYKAMWDEYCKKEVSVDDIFNIMKEKSERNGSWKGKDGQDKLESPSDKTNFSSSEPDDESKEEIYDVHKRFNHAYKEKNRRKKEIIESRMKILIQQRNYFQMQVKQLQQELLMAKMRKNDTACSMTELEEDFNNLRLTHSMLTYEFFPEDKEKPASGKLNNT
ncbi:hypothetical protein LOTGIDRAFT_154941 [Lottia gigantea]|uniref:Uncharacterized protein n=1 Tax=Lottia gigantea TaxID=225164 RepID=V3ZMC0_LOTGI|nr:hypothetical protein LOTGIDRAFT_154941 [Lottia gigantea]ESO85447.1 hypothetical protein LOTGIDRAFT_154941 [Lottia gigantea]